MVIRAMEQVEDDREVPQIQYNFVTLAKLEELDKDAMCGEPM